MSEPLKVTAALVMVLSELVIVPLLIVTNVLTVPPFAYVAPPLPVIVSAEVPLGAELRVT